LDPDETLSVASLALQNDLLTVNTVRLAVPTAINNLPNCNSLNLLLTKFHNKKTTVCKSKCKPINLHDEQIPAIERSTILVKIIANGVTYEPGDHLGIFPENQSNIVDGILKKITGFDNPDEILQLQILKENQTSNGKFKKINYIQFNVFKIYNGQVFLNHGSHTNAYLFALCAQCLVVFWI